MYERPDYLVKGEAARLFPVLSESSKEMRTLSAFLSCFSLIDEFGSGLLASLGRKAGKRSQIETFTEVVFKDQIDKDLRPDGLIIHRTGQKVWRALVEAKIRKNELEKSQVEDYLRLAREHKIDAVITVSNQFATSPHHSPVHSEINGQLLRSVEMFHWSWSSIRTQAILLTSDQEVVDSDQFKVLEEFVRFLNHDSAGVASFDQMNSEWKDVVLKVQNGARLAKTSNEVEATVASWHQEVRDLCLQESERLNSTVSVKLPRTHKADPGVRLKADCEKLAENKRLECTLQIPNAAAPIDVRADLSRRAIVIGMRVSAPGDRKRSTAKINWLTRQLQKTEAEGFQIRAFSQGKSAPMQASLEDVKENPECIVRDNSTASITGFEILLVQDLAAKFSGRKSFIASLEEAVPRFYDDVGQYVRAWVEAPPKPKNTEEISEKTETDPQF